MQAVSTGGRARNGYGLFAHQRDVQVAASGEPHTEGAGDQTAVVLFSFRGTTGGMILYLDETSNVEFRLRFPDFKASLAHRNSIDTAPKSQGHEA
jgi:hypothetical protein